MENNFRVTGNNNPTNHNQLLEAQFKQIQSNIMNLDLGPNTNLINQETKLEIKTKIVPLTAAINLDGLNSEMLNKIKFFITTYRGINANQINVDIENGIFYDQTNNQSYIVKKNPYTNQYEIQLTNQLTQQPIEHATVKEQTDQKVRKLVHPSQMQNHRAAFTNVSFLVINVISFILLTAMIILLNK